MNCLINREVQFVQDILYSYVCMYNVYLSLGNVSFSIVINFKTNKIKQLYICMLNVLKLAIKVYMAVAGI